MTRWWFVHLQNSEESILSRAEQGLTFSHFLSTTRGGSQCAESVQGPHQYMPIVDATIYILYARPCARGSDSAKHHLASVD